MDGRVTFSVWTHAIFWNLQRTSSCLGKPWGPAACPVHCDQPNDRASPAPAKVSFSWAFPPVSGWITTFSTSFGFNVHVHCARPSSEPSSSSLSNQQLRNAAFNEREPLEVQRLSEAAPLQLPHGDHRQPGDDSASKLSFALRNATREIPHYPQQDSRPIPIKEPGRKRVFSTHWLCQVIGTDGDLKGSFNYSR